LKPVSVMLIAGEASGDVLAAELVRQLGAQFIRSALRPTLDVQPLHTSLSPQFFGAGGTNMAEAGVELAVDLTAHAVVGLAEVLKRLRTFKKLFDQLVLLAIQRQPDVIVCVDFSGFNRRFAHAVKNHVRSTRGAFRNWDPKIVQYVSPQVWASRPGRAKSMAEDFDLVLTIFPFETEWYRQHVPELRTEFVGHPMIDRYAEFRDRVAARSQPAKPTSPTILLLPGSRPGELKRHLPPMLDAVERISKAQAAQFEMVLPNHALLPLAHAIGGPKLTAVKVQIGDLAEALLRADLAVASTGTVTMECAYFGVPTVAMYITSWSTYQIGKRIIKVPYLAMPNLLASESVFPELIQQEATAENITREVLALLNAPQRREAIRSKLSSLTSSLGDRYASRRAATAVVSLILF